MPRHLFLAIGGFDGTFRFAAGEDREFCDRWRHHGLQVIYRSDSVVTHAHFLSFRSYCRQHFNYGRGGYHFHHLQAQRNSSAAKFESPSFYWNLIIHPWTATAPVRSVKLVALMIVSQIANALGYFYEAALHELSLKRMRHSGQG